MANSLSQFNNDDAVTSIRTDAIQRAIISANASSPTQVVAGVASQSIYVTDVIISTDTAMNIKLQDSNSTVLMQSIYVPANSVFSKQFKTPIKVAASANLNVLASTSGNISVTVTGWQV